MSTITNIPYIAKSMNGIIVISDGEAIMENGDIQANTINADNINSVDHNVDGNLTVSGNVILGTNSLNTQSINGKMTFNTNLPECGLAPSTANQLVNKNYTDTNFVYKTGSISETITGIKTFSVPPENSSTITTNSQLTNKLYVDTKFNSIDLSNYVTLNTAQTGISGNKTFSGTNTHTGANTFTNDGNTFNTTSSNFTLTNPAFTAFTGFTAPVYPTMTYLVSAGTATGNFTNNGWTWVRGNTNCEIIWSAGNNGLEYYGSVPPGYSYCVFNRAVAGSVFYQEQSSLTFTAGKQYVLKFWSYWGWVNAYSGGSRTGLIRVSIGNSTDTYAYNDQDTRVALTWRQHIFRFSVTSTTTTGYIRFTATDTAPAGQSFPFALGGITLREYSSVKLTDTSQSLNSFIAGDFNLQRNLFTQNLYGTGDFGTSSGRGTFYAPAPNINCLCINNNTFNTGTSYNSIAIGKASYFVANAASDCINIGNYQNLVSDGTQVSKAGKQMIEIGNNHEGASANGSILIGHYIRQLKPLVGYSVAIGNEIGANGTGTAVTGYGVGSRTIAIGHGIFSGNADPFSRPSPDYSVMIGYLAGRNNGDYYNCGIGSFALNSMNGVAGTIPGNITTQFNTALGYQAGRNQTDLNRCTLIGANTDNTVNSITDTTALGYNAKCGANFATAIGSGVTNNTANSVRIGRNTDTCFIDGNFTLAGSLSLPSASIADSALSTNISRLNTAETYSALKTFTGGITASGTQTITFGTNAPTMSGANISSASIPDSALSTNISRLNTAETYSALKTFTGGITASGTQTITFGTNAPTMSGANISSASIPDSALSSNISRLNTAQTYSALKTFTGGITASGTQTITFGTNAPTMSGANISSASIPDSALSSNISRLNTAQTYSATRTFTGGITASGTQTITFGTNAPTMSGANITGIPDAALSSNIPREDTTNLFTQVNTFSKPIQTYKQTLQNVEIGSDVVNAATNSNHTGINSVYIGYQTGYSLNAGIIKNNNNVILGAEAARTMTQSIDNVFIGYQAGKNLNTTTNSSNQNVLIGAGCFNNIANVVNCVNIGYQSGTGITTATTWDSNVTIGAKQFITDCKASSQSVFIGSNIYADNTAAISNNILIGQLSSISGNYSSSVAIGRASVINKSNTFFIGDSDYSYDTILNNRIYPLRASETVINAATTLSTPLYEYYSVTVAATTYTITLPTITAKMLGTKLTFRRVGGTVTTVISFAPSGGQYIYNFQNVGNTTSLNLLGNTRYTTTIVALPNNIVSGYAWFELYQNT